MLQQILDAFEVVPDYDLNIMKDRQTLFDITTNILNGIKEVLEKEKANADRAWQRQKAMESQAAQLTEKHTLTADLIGGLFTRIEVFHDHHFHITFSFQDELIREAAHG